MMKTFWVYYILYIFVTTGSSFETSNITLPEELIGKHESLLSCPVIEVGPEHYELLPDGSVRLESYNLTLEEPFYVLGNGTLFICSIESYDDPCNPLPKELEGKNETLCHCPSIEVEPEYYELLPNRSARLEVYNLTLDEPFYIIYNETLIICSPLEREMDEEKEHLTWTSYVTLVGLVISMVGLFLHLVVFCLVPDLRNLPGWNLATLCTCLFVSYLLILVIGTDEVLEHRNTCIALGSVSHFFLLSSFLWMSIMSCDVYVSLLRATGRFRSSNTHFSKRRFGLYCLCAFGIALVFSILGVLADQLEFVPERVRPKFEQSCWFTQRLPLLIFFAGPVILLSCLNFLLFGASAYIIHVNKRKSDQDAQQPALKRRYLMYFRLSVIMGVTWIVGIAANVVNTGWLWFIFVLLNALQGFFIFLAFTCCKKVKKYFRQKITGSRRSSQQTLTTPTFQSYCHYDNSIEKDLDKIAKEKVDTIMIQL